MGTLLGFPVNALIVGAAMAYAGLMGSCAVAVLVGRWLRSCDTRRDRAERTGMSDSDPIENEVKGWPIVPDEAAWRAACEAYVPLHPTVRPSHTVPDAALEPSARAAVSEIREKKEITGG